MVRALLLSLAQLTDPAVLRVLVRSTAVTLGLFALLGLALWAGGRALLAPWLGDGSGGVAGVVAVLAAVLAGWLLFRSVAVAVVGVFADEIVAAVERRHYPAALATARPVPLANSLSAGVRSGGRAIAVNLLLLPLYLVLLATGIGTAALFLVANGWLLGRDLGDMVASRHLDDAAVRRWRKATGLSRFALGLANAVLFVVPVANLVAPVLGAAMATHLFHRRRA